VVTAEEDEDGLVQTMDAGSEMVVPKNGRMVGRVGEVTVDAEGNISVFGAGDPDGNLRIRLALRQRAENSGDIWAGELGLDIGVTATDLGLLLAPPSSVSVSFDMVDKTASMGSVIP
jgi:hypothetical protein